MDQEIGNGKISGLGNGRKMGQNLGQEMGGNGKQYNIRNLIFQREQEKKENSGTIREASFQWSMGKLKKYRRGKEDIQYDMEECNSGKI